MTEAPSRDERAVVAIDCDEVLAQFVPALAEWHNAELGARQCSKTCSKTYRCSANHCQHAGGARRSLDLGSSRWFPRRAAWQVHPLVRRRHPHGRSLWSLNATSIQPYCPERLRP